MRTGIFKTCVLINPEAIFDLAEHFVDSPQFCRQILTGLLIRVLDHLDFGTIGGKDVKILFCHLGIDKTTKAKSMIGTNLCQTDAGIAGTGFNYERVGIDLTRLQSPFNNGDAWPVLGTAARVQSFQFCKTIKM